MMSDAPKSRWPFYDAIWLELFESAFLEDPRLAEIAARLWQSLLSQIEAGPQGLTQARQCLEQAIRTFPFTETFKAEKAPLAILNAAIETKDPKRNQSHSRTRKRGEQEDLPKFSFKREPKTHDDVVLTK